MTPAFAILLVSAFLLLLGVSRNTVAMWLREYGLPTRAEAVA